VLGHFVTVYHGADCERDLGRAAQRFFGAPDAALDGDQLFLGGIEQLASLAGALIGEHRIAAHHQALTRIIGRGDLGEIAHVEQRRLNGARLDQAAWCEGLPKSPRALGASLPPEFRRRIGPRCFSAKRVSFMQQPFAADSGISWSSPC
jgi:hypothetical protein